VHDRKDCVAAIKQRRIHFRIDGVVARKPAAGSP
jgi:hypothetical protein